MSITSKHKYWQTRTARTRVRDPGFSDWRWSSLPRSSCAGGGQVVLAGRAPARVVPGGDEVRWKRSALSTALRVAKGDRAGCSYVREEWGPGPHQPEG
eukprot:3438030-Rhodomonas_salina.3